MNIAVFVSGNGSNLQALIDARARGDLAAGEIKLVVSDQAEAFALKRAEEAGIRTVILEPNDFSSREDFDDAVVEELKKDKIEVVVLAGFMRLLSGVFIEEYRNRILNIHPSLLPSFKGIHGIRDAFEYGVKITGVTVHFVNEELDAGPVIAQRAIEVKADDTLESLEKKIHKAEHEVYPEVVRSFIEGKLFIEDGKVRIAEDIV